MQTLSRFLIRRASKRDAGRIAGIQLRSWQAACEGLVPVEKLDALDFSTRETLWKEMLTTPEEMVLVAIKGVRMAGFCTLSPSNDPDAAPATAEIRSLFVDPVAWGRGAGRELAEEIVEQARRLGYSRVTQWVLDANDRARDFCEKAGFLPDGKVKIEHVSGCPVREVRYSMAL